MSKRIKDYIQRDHYQKLRRGIEYPEVEIRNIWHYVFDDLVDNGYISKAPSSADVSIFAATYECRINSVWPMPNLTKTLETLRNTRTRLGIVLIRPNYNPVPKFTV